MTHHCHWPGCTVETPPAMWGCRKHWFTLPHSIRSAIWKAYRPGQEVDKKPSREYLEAALHAKKWAAEFDRQASAGNIIKAPKKKRQPNYKPRWCNVRFCALKDGTWFKATRKQSTWWVKRGEVDATSPNSEVASTWEKTDEVWIDLNMGTSLAESL